MFKKFLPLFLLVSSFASARELSMQEIKERFEIRADIYQMDGKKIVGSTDRTSYWRMNPENGDLHGDWSSNFGGGTIAIRYNWKLESDGSVKATLEEFGKVSKDSEFSQPIAKKEYTLENFEPIVWKVLSIKDKNYVVRFIPSVRDTATAVTVGDLPVAGTDLSFTDNAGYLWASETDLGGKYIGVTTHRGTLALSYVPFKGAKEMGTVEGKEIVIKVDKKYKISVKSDTAFLPAGVTGKVYALYLPEKKSKGVNSVHSFSSSSEDRFLKSLER